jgi:phenylacetic acid degradation operon negative regulatory protein
MSRRRRLPDLGIRPLTARSLALSALLGTHPPTLPARALVALAAPFGLAEGAMRTALSRMAAGGEVIAEDGRYTLGPRLVERQASQDAGRTAPAELWDRTWWFAIVDAERRTMSERRAFRSRMRHLRMGELRPDVWLRPANLQGPPAEQGLLVTRGPLDGRDDGDVVRRLWDVDGTAATGRRLLPLVAEAQTWLEDDDPAVLPDTFMVSVAAARFLLADPLLPRELVGPDWPGDALRDSYDRLERAHTRLMGAFLSTAGITSLDRNDQQA